MREGILSVDKTPGWTSFDVVKKLRGITGIRKIGHAGTLDPFASGLMVVAMGRAYTRQINKIQSLPKTYLATAVFGKHTDTYDREGQLDLDQSGPVRLTRAEVAQVFPEFVGSQRQTPPPFSAKKINGRRAYSLARQGKAVQLEDVEIHIDELTLLDFQNGDYPEVQFKLRCSKGTYVRQLAVDIAARLGTVAHLTQLRRTHIGEFDVKHAIQVDTADYATILEKVGGSCDLISVA